MGCVLARRRGTSSRGLRPLGAARCARGASSAALARPWTHSGICRLRRRRRSADWYGSGAGRERCDDGRTIWPRPLAPAGAAASDSGGGPPGGGAPAELPDLLEVVEGRGRGRPDLVRRFIAVLQEWGGSAVEWKARSTGGGGWNGLRCARPRRRLERAGLDVSTLTIGPDATRAQLDAIELAIVPAGSAWPKRRDLGG